MDIVVNHSGDEHEWFKHRAAVQPEQSPYRDYHWECRGIGKATIQVTVI